jgi:HD-like signal output (HDOD) protein
MSDIQQQLQEVTELISLPEVYLKVQRLMNDPTVELHPKLTH